MRVTKAAHFSNANFPPEVGYKFSSNSRLSFLKATVLAVVRNVDQPEQCAQVCLQEAYCAASRHHEVQHLCDLLRASLVRWEGPGRTQGPVEIRTMPERRFGRCPASYDTLWGALRYRWSQKMSTWSEAAQSCHSDGGKLVEITSHAEKKAVLAMTLARRLTSVLVGGVQDPQERRTYANWRWHQSGLAIDDASWIDVSDKKRELNWLSVIVNQDELKYMQISVDFRSKYLCECLSLE